jgi:hypothetical protein
MLFNDTVSLMWTVYCQVKYRGDYSDLKKTEKEMVVACFKVLSEHSAKWLSSPIKACSYVSNWECIYMDFDIVHTQKLLIGRLLC